MYRILDRKELNSTVTLLEIEAPLVAKKAKAGQFIILRVDEDGEVGVGGGAVEHAFGVDGIMEILREF